MAASEVLAVAAEVVAVAAEVVAAALEAEALALEAKVGLAGDTKTLGVDAKASTVVLLIMKFQTGTY